MKNIPANYVDVCGQLSCNLKAACVAYVLEHLMDELDPHVSQVMSTGISFPPIGEHFDSSDSGGAISKIDTFLLLGTTRSGIRVLDMILRQVPLNHEERDVLANWREKAFQSVFEITGVDRESVRLLDSRAEVSYTVYANDIEVASALFPSLSVGSFLITNLVPVHDLWFLSGAQQLYSRSDEQRLMRMLAENFSAVAQYRNNPEKLERARAMQKEEYDRFVRLFKTDEVLASGKEISHLTEIYYKTRAEEMGHSAPVLPAPFENKEEEYDLGLVMDEREGMHYFSGYREFVDVFARDIGTRGSLTIVRGYLEDDSLPAFVFRRVAERFPENFRSVMRTVLGRSYAASDPVQDFESIMDDFKHGWRDTYPSIHPVNRRMQKYLYARSGVGRNGPCPCGSGKKYKKCHG